VEDHRQKLNETFGLVMTRASTLCAIAIVVKLVATNQRFSEGAELQTTELTPAEEFRRDSPIVLFMAALEMLACGACALTAAAMYRRRRHRLVHPAESDEKVREMYIQVELAKELTSEDPQIYGVSFRPSTDGLECLLIESIRWGSLLDKWNRKKLEPSPEELVEEALGSPTNSTSVSDHLPAEDRLGFEGGDDAGGRAAEAVAAQDAVADIVTESSSSRPPSSQHRQVETGSAIVAVNDVSGDVGMMQMQLLKPKVTLWVRAELSHASKFEESLALPDSDAPPATSSTNTGNGATAPNTLGNPVDGIISPDRGTNGSMTTPSSIGLSILRIVGLNVTQRGPCCACVALEDEEPQILTRWLTCSLLFGWVTMLPVLFMQPQEDRPRQHLFRQFLLKPCLLVLPVWVILWLLDCVQVGINVQLIHPFYYFAIVHMLLPSILVWYLMQMQAADEQLVLEQRGQRQKEVESALLAVEDPAPTFLRELIMINPVALVWLGSVASVPIVISSLLTRFQSERFKMAQKTVSVVYGPLVFLQIAFVYTLWSLKFEDLPKLYLAGFGLLLSVPCFVVWCMCIVCSSRYGREDLTLVRAQRIERAKVAKAKSLGQALDVEANANPATAEDPENLIDCSEAQFREWELVYSA
jgi:hypothetical protein